MSSCVLQVTPVVARIPDVAGLRLVANPAEVSAIFHAPLHMFLEDTPAHRHSDAELWGHKFRVHHFDHAGRDIWGLTAAFLINVAEAAFGRQAAFQTWHPESEQMHF